MQVTSKSHLCAWWMVFCLEKFAKYAQEYVYKEWGLLVSLVDTYINAPNWYLYFNTKCWVMEVFREFWELYL